MRKVPSLSTSPEKVFFIVVTESSDDMLEDHAKDTDRSELSGFIRGANVDERLISSP